MALSKKEREGLRASTSSPHVHHHHTHSAEKKRHKKKILIYSFSSFFIIAIILIAGFGIVQATKPGPLDDFAKCLSENDAVMYGASFCQYSNAQKAMFGKSKKHLTLKDYTENSDVRVTPTWYVGDEKIENVQTLRRLADLTGCTLPGYEALE